MNEKRPFADISDTELAHILAITERLDTLLAKLPRERLKGQVVDVLRGLDTLIELVGVEADARESLANFYAAYHTMAEFLDRNNTPPTD